MVDIQTARNKIYTLIGVLYAVHNELGPWLSERIYQEGLQLELEARHIPYKRELTFHPLYKGQQMASDYRLDFLVDDIIVELKAVNRLNREHRAQLFNYMRLYKPMAGILVNFAPKSCEVERYLYDKNLKEVLTVSGAPITYKAFNEELSEFPT